MSHETNDLRSTLARLHEQLDAARDVTPATRALLQTLIDDLQGLLDTEALPTQADSESAGAGEKQRDSIIGRLTAAERQFEVTHPTLAGVLSRLIDGLGDMGI